jgi:prepilin-type N-terminal cleavage/methylation domain-containing protein
MNNKLQTTSESEGQARNHQRKMRTGFTLIEFMVAIAASLILVLVVGTLLVSGQRSWARAFSYAYAKPQIDALTSTITFGTFGRKANKMDYKLYKIVGGKFVPAVPLINPEEVVTGEAVEFHYWDTDLDAAIMKTSIKGTAYALFYIDGDKLMLDIGPLPPGGVDAAGHRLEGDHISTITLAENVTDLEFSHTTRNMEGDGKGCVRMNVTIDSADGNTPTTVTAATLMRNTWP